jgi:hypothetical protein
MRPDRLAIILPGVIVAVGCALVAMRADPPAPAVAGRCASAAAVLLMLKMIAVVARMRTGGGREARLLTFVVFVAIVMGWFGAERAIADAAFNYQVHAQKSALVAASRDLSREILAFVDARHRAAPPRPRPETWDGDVAAWLRFESETVRDYNRRFGARVRTAHDLLTLRSLRDADFDAFYRAPDGEFQIAIVARKLTVLADRLAREP